MAGHFKVHSLIKRAAYLLCGTSFFLIAILVSKIGSEEIESFYKQSLHFTGAGQRFWYERGFKQITNLPYEVLECKNCHFTSCDRCHKEFDSKKATFSVSKAKRTETCMPCHGRESVSSKLDREQNALDVHEKAGMICTDCHLGEDMHGDGISYTSQREPGAVKADCLLCHSGKQAKGSIYLADLPFHKIHKEKLDCAACHVRAAMNCYNCHFDTVLKTGSRKDAFIPYKSWLLLVNYKGKITSGNAQTLVYKGKKYIVFVPYLTHSIMAKGRNCEDCHDNKAMKRIREGKTIPMVTFKDGKLITWEGVVPLVPDKLEWTFLDKKEGKWAVINNQEKPLVQFSLYAEPLTPQQLEKLDIHFK
jgi:hypothetical protein